VGKAWPPPNSQSIQASRDRLEAIRPLFGKARQGCSGLMEHVNYPAFEIRGAMNKPDLQQAESRQDHALITTKQQIVDRRHQARNHFGLVLLICFQIVICCVSLVYVSSYNNPNGFVPATFHIFYDPARLSDAVIAIAAFAPVAFLFILADFSFGYLTGFFFFTMILGYLWLNCFTDLSYDHRLAGLSAAASAVTFLLPALFISSPVRPMYLLSTRSFDRMLTFLLLFCIAAIALGATFNFRVVALETIYQYREKLYTPTPINYLVKIASGALLPFAFAGFVARKAPWRASAVLVLLLLCYPITLSKTVFFAPFWLIAALGFSRIFEARITTVLLLLGPILAGLAIIILFNTYSAFMFSTVNFRMIAIPSVAMDVYNDFFATHELTHFCQISLLKQIMPCPYQEQLSVLMQRAYGLGNFNASLFATEGIASVGLFFAPVTTFLCGLVIAFGNRLSAGLPPRFILISGAILPQILLNVPLTTALLTHGAGILFLLWYITPREIFKADDRRKMFGRDMPMNMEADGRTTT
jgi:hypothetical protein